MMLSSSPVGWLIGPLLGIVLALLLALMVVYFRSCYSYWRCRGVGSPDPVWGLGNLYARLRPTLSMAEFDMWLYRDCGGSRFCGFYEFTTPVLMVGEPELLKHIMIRDFDHFCDRSFVTFNEPVMDDMLLGLKGSVWKRVRSVMTPTFSSGKIKQTFGLVNDCARNLCTYFNKQLDQGRSVYEMKEVYGIFTMDTIASIAFGVSSDSLNNTQDEFSAAAARFFAAPPAWKRPLLLLQMCWPAGLARRCGLSAFYHRSPMDFFSKVVSDTIKYRLEHKLRRSDFLQLLLDASLQEKSKIAELNATRQAEAAARATQARDKFCNKGTQNGPNISELRHVNKHRDHSGRPEEGFTNMNSASNGITSTAAAASAAAAAAAASPAAAAAAAAAAAVNGTPPGGADKTTEPLQPVLTEQVITAQCVLFYMAGYDTTATTLSFVSYCLALHPAVQQRCMEEVEAVIARHGGAITYDSIQEMTYLDMVFAETLRLYPPAPRVDRCCTKPYTLPGTRVTLEVGTKITIPIYSIHRDSRYYPDPERFNPDRFLPENKNSRPQGVYMPFGSGPRNCIGKRFALMESKIALVHLLQEFALLPCKQTQVPIKLERRSGLLKAQDGVWVRLAKRVAE